MASYEWPPNGSAGGGVLSLNTLTGLVVLAAGSGIGLTTSGNTITIASTGLLSINSDVTQAQTLSVGTAGTDFAIVDAGSGSHVFNLPTASATNRGALSSADWATFNGKQASGNYLTALTGDGTASGPGSSALTLATVNSNTGTFASVTVNGKGLVTAASALSGDATTSGSAITLATVNSNIGSFGSSTSIPSFTVNAKGLITAAGSSVVIAPAGTLTGTTLNSTIVSSSLTSVGTIATGIWNGTSIAIANGGTGQTTANAAFNALSPMTTSGDLIYGGASGAGTRLAGNTTSTINFLAQTGTGSASAAPAWTAFTVPTVQALPSGTGATYTLPTSPRKPLYIKVRAVGGGGGGGGSNASGGTGGTGGNTLFGSSLITAGGGAGGVGGGTNSTGGVGGTASVTTSSTVIQLAALSGGSGQAGLSEATYSAG